MYSQDDLTDEIAKLESGKDPELAEYVLMLKLFNSISIYKQLMIEGIWNGFWSENCDSPFK